MSYTFSVFKTRPGVQFALSKWELLGQLGPWLAKGAGSAGGGCVPGGASRRLVVDSVPSEAEARGLGSVEFSKSVILHGS